MQFEERVIGCFEGLATGDAIGKQTEMLSTGGVKNWYPGGVRGFHGRPGDVIPRYAQKPHAWRIGETTDDTEQTLAVMRALLHEGRATHEGIGRELLGCRKSLHPGVSLWDFVQNNDAARRAEAGDGCGAAMRSAPVGVLYPSDCLDELVWSAYECAIPTHGGAMAICAAAAVAGAISAALEGRPVDEVSTVAIRAARTAERLRPDGRGAAIGNSIEEIYADLAASQHVDASEVAKRHFPDEPRNIVPLAIALALATRSAEQTALVAANVGGDADSVASIGGAIAGALDPKTVNQGWVEVVKATNGDELTRMARLLAAKVRESSASPTRTGF